MEVGASLGLARYPSEAQDAEALIELSDRRMFEVKRRRGEGRR